MLNDSAPDSETKPFHAFAIVCLLPLSILAATAIAAATGIPKPGAGEPPAQESPVAAPAVAPDAGAVDAASVQDPVAAPKDAAQDTAAVSVSPLAERMEILQSGMREMRRMLGKPEQSAELLALLAKLQSAALGCVELVPASTAAIEAPAARAESRIGYQRRMVEVLDTLLQLELAVHKGDADGAKALYKALGEKKQSGHDAYQ